MAERARPETSASGLQPRWPPSAEPQGVGLSTGAVLLILVGLTSIGHIAVALAPKDQGPTPYIRWQVISAVLELIVWLGVVVGLGWRRAAGLVVGSPSLWGILPLAALSIASLFVASRAEEGWVGPGLQLAIAIGVFVSALTEEVAFRGFLLHGLTTRLGGALAVVAGGAIFAAYHLPVLIRDDVRGSGMVVVLLFHFGFGVFLCRVRAQTGSIWFPTAIHTLWNLTATEIALWSFPDGSYPAVFGWIKLAVNVTGLCLAYGLLSRATLVPTARGLVTGLPPAPGDHGAAPIDWRHFYERLAQAPSEDVYGRFTEGAHRTVVFAEEEAKSEGATTVRTEHLLLALTHASDGAAAEALDLEGIPTFPHTSRGSDGDRSEDMHTVPFDTHARMVLQLAVMEADARNHPHVGTEHLLSAVTALRRSGAARVLRRAGFDRNHLRRTTLGLLSERAWSTQDDGSEDRTDEARDPPVPT